MTYAFKVQARNSYGFSLDSDEFTVLCASQPEAPSMPTTSIDANKVVVTWATPVTNGSPITAYKVYIRQQDQLTYTLESTECDGTDATVISSTTCEILLTTLIVAPFSLELNESIYAKIVASNFYGDSSYSTSGNGALTKLVPDAPINLANDETVTTDLTIRFTWSQGLSDGGVAVTDYQVYYDQGTSSYTLLADAVADTFY